MAKQITAIERVVSALTYVTVGWFGLIYCVILQFQKKRISNYIRFNVYQSVFIALLFFLCCAVFGLIFTILSHIPIIQKFVSWIQLVLLSPILFDRSIIQLLIGSIILYSAIMSLLGREPRIYWVSKIIDQNIR